MNDTFSAPRLPRKKRWIFPVFILLNIAIILYIAYTTFKDGSQASLADIWTLWMKHPLPFVIGILSIPLTLLFDGLGFHACVKTVAPKERFATSLKVATTGHYYGEITPSNAGREAYTIWYYTRNGTANATSIALLFYAAIHVSSTILTVLGMIFYWSEIVAQAVSVTRIGLFVMALLASIFNLLVPLFYFLIFLSEKKTKKFLFWFVRVFHLKNREQKEEKIAKYLDETRAAIQALKGQAGRIILALLFTTLGRITFSLPLYSALAASGMAISIPFAVSVNMVLSSAAALFPVPGYGGLLELFFTGLFSGTQANYVFWSMILWRFESYFVYLPVGFTVMLVTSKRKRVKSNPKCGTMNNDEKKVTSDAIGRDQESEHASTEES